jgi:hypothetical protein
MLGGGLDCGPKPELNRLSVAIPKHQLRSQGCLRLQSIVLREYATSRNRIELTAFF